MRSRSALAWWTIAAAAAIAIVLLVRELPVDRVPGLLDEVAARQGRWGPLVFGAFYVVAVLLLVPGAVLTLGAGALYGVLRGTLIVSLASTTAAALAFLLARHVARDTVRRRVERSPRLAAVDRAIGEQGWKVVALLRLSPAVPFNIQNYLYGVTSIRFWPAVLASWVAMLPGTFLFVYLGSLGRTALSGRDTTPAEWMFRGLGLAATVAVTVYVTRIARRAMRAAELEAKLEKTG